MGNPPAAIIIARHGARLDAADKNWHLTSPTPYDPPLSYGGWLQSRALGTRIISLLNSRDDGDSPSESSSANSARSSPQPRPVQPPKRKHRIIIHTSPYLRCLQTAIAVGSGISQYHPSPDSDTVGASTSPDGNANATASSPPRDSHRSSLRVDAFLGEWLCPDYFDDITPPPSSERLVAAAKEELLRRSVIAVPPADMSSKAPTGYFPGGWGSSSTPASPDPEDGAPLDAVKGQRLRAGSYDTLNPPVSNHRSKGLLRKLNTNLSSIPDDIPGGYLPPTPSYAIASSDPIPAGYVSHARNACVKVDYQWDSMHNPQQWGHGGDYGEELGAMHTRFRNGLEGMAEWYQDHDPTPGRRHNAQSTLAEKEDDDDEMDTVLVLITHGAGCNAMVGALTGEPVLLDFNTASLTMAVRKHDFQDPYMDGAHGRGRSSSNPSTLQDYELKLAASVDHLRPGINPLQGGSPTVPPPTSSPSPLVSSYRPRLPSSRPSMSQGQFIIGPSPAPELTSQPWMNGRPSTAPRGGPGLWGSLSPGADVPVDSADDIVPNFGDPISFTPSGNGEDTESQSEESEDQFPQPTSSQRGLWGSGPLKKEPETGVKRRWTVTERRV